jgi:hypothetical protein
MLRYKPVRYLDILVLDLVRLDRGQALVPVRIPQVLALLRTADRYLAFRAAADGTNIAADARTEALWSANPADRASHSSSIERGVPQTMSRTNLFIKVEVEHDGEEDPQRLGEEICRQIGKVYGVLSAELSSFTTSEE